MDGRVAERLTSKASVMSSTLLDIVEELEVALDLLGGQRNGDVIDSRIAAPALPHSRLPAVRTMTGGK